MEFKKGDKVVVKKEAWPDVHNRLLEILRKYNIDTVFTVENVMADSIFLSHPSLKGEPCQTAAHRWNILPSIQKPEEVKTVATTTKEEKHKKSWSFHSTHPDDVDMHAIARDCTKKNPLLFIEHGDTKKVMVHKNLTVKARTCGINVPNEDQNGRIFFYGEAVLFADVYSKFSEWVGWAKKVKVAKWPAETRNPCKVTVHTPTV